MSERHPRTARLQRGLRVLACAGAVTLLGAPTSALAQLTDSADRMLGREVVERDSAGVRIILNDGLDRSLRWVFRERVIIGDRVEGPAAFYMVYPWTIAADTLGRIYVLDVGEARLAVFDSTGVFLRELGGTGPGPGEFLNPAGIAVAPDGSVAVLDLGKRALVRFGSEGWSEEPLPFPESMPIRGFSAAGRNILVGVGDSPLKQYGLLLLGTRDTTHLGKVEESPAVFMNECSAGVSGLRPVLSSSIKWSSYGSRVAVNSSPDYTIDIYEGSTKIMSARRAVPRWRITRDMALREPAVQSGMTIRLADGRQCHLPPQAVLEMRGYASRRSPIEGMRISPDGTIWVPRHLQGQGMATDVLDSNGVYLGTLPSDFPFPSAFTPAGDPIALTLTPRGAPRIVVYERVRREK